MSKSCNIKAEKPRSKQTQQTLILMLQPAILSQSPLFRGILEGELSSLFGQIHFQVKTYPKNEQIVTSGEVCDRLLIIQRGSVKAEMNDYSGKTIKIEDIEA